MKKSNLQGVSMRDRLALAKSERTRVGVFLSNDGIEVSIPNIIVAVSVSIALIAAVIIGVIWIVPWTQDQNAKSQLSTVQSAEQLYYAQNSVYGTITQLQDNSTGKASLLAGNSTFFMNVVTTSPGSYCVGIKSSTGAKFYADSNSTNITSTQPAACPAIP